MVVRGGVCSILFGWPLYLACPPLILGLHCVLVDVLRFEDSERRSNFVSILMVVVLDIFEAHVLVTLVLVYKAV